MAKNCLVIIMFSLQLSVPIWSETSPTPVRAHVHDTIQLNCTKDREKILWLHNSKVVVKYGVIEQGYRDRMSWNNINDNDRNLVIRDVQLTDIGLYECLADITLKEYDVIVDGEARSTLKYIRQSFPTLPPEYEETTTQEETNSGNINSYNYLLYQMTFMLSILHSLHF